MRGYFNIGKLASDFIPTITSATLLSASWTENTYSFETEYPSTQYNIEVQPSETCDYEQLSAWCNALIIGSSTENIITALGDIPTVDIPIMIKAVMK